MNAGMRPLAASMMILPVGVGRTSRGPIGVEGLTMTAGKTAFRHHGLDQSFGRDLAAFVGADALIFAQRSGLVRGHPVGSHGDGRHAAGVDDALDARPHRLLHEDAGSLDVGGKDLAGVARPEAIIRRHMKNVAHAGYRAPDGFPVAQIAFEKLQV